MLVVGGGPVGLLLAGELQRRGVDHLLIEAKKEPVYFCKALGVSPRTLEVFDQIGVLDEALDRGLWLRGQVSAVNGADIRTSDFPSQDTRYFTLVLAQYDTEDILRDNLQGVGGHVQAGVSLHLLEIAADRVAARVTEEVQNAPSSVATSWAATARAAPCATGSRWTTRATPTR